MAQQAAETYRAGSMHRLAGMKLFRSRKSLAVLGCGTLLTAAAAFVIVPRGIGAVKNQPQPSARRHAAASSPAKHLAKYEPANDYSVTNDSDVLSSYRQAIASNYYLGESSAQVASAAETPAVDAPTVISPQPDAGQDGTPE